MFFVELLIFVSFEQNNLTILIWNCVSFYVSLDSEPLALVHFSCSESRDKYVTNRWASWLVKESTVVLRLAYSSCTQLGTGNLSQTGKLVYKTHLIMNRETENRKEYYRPVKAEEDVKKCCVGLKLHHNAKWHLFHTHPSSITRLNTNLRRDFRLHGIFIKPFPSV